MEPIIAFLIAGWLVVAGQSTAHPAAVACNVAGKPGGVMAYECRIAADGGAISLVVEGEIYFDAATTVAVPPPEVY